MYARIAMLKEPWPKELKHHMEETEIEESDEDAGDSITTIRVCLLILLLFLQTHIIVRNVRGKKVVILSEP